MTRSARCSLRKANPAGTLRWRGPRLAVACLTLGLWLLAPAIPANAQSAVPAVFPPYAASDSRVVLDIGIAALGPRNTWRALPAGIAVGQVPGQTAGVLSDTAGFVPNGGGYLYAQNALTASASAQGTIYVRLARAALAVDDSTATGTNFFDSTGNTGGGYSANAATVFTLFNGGNTLLQWAMGPQASGPAILDAGSWVYPGSRYVNSHGSPNLDATAADIVFTWQGPIYWAYLDGVPVAYGTLPTALPALGQFQTLVIGGYLGGSGVNGKPLGAYPILRFQVSTAFSPPPVLQGAPTIGFYGDSFVVQGAGLTADPPSAPTVAALNALQAQTDPTLAPNAISGVLGQTGFISRCEAYAQKAYGGYAPFYTAAKSGHGWAYSGMGGTTADNTPAIDDFALGKTVFSDALNAARPDYVFGFGSVNDVNNGSPANLVGDVQTHFDYWANNNPNLKGIFFIEPLSWELSLTGATQTAWAAKMAGQRAQLRAAFGTGGVAGARKVPVTYIKSYETWVQGANAARFLIASNPANHTQSALTGSAPNGHPDAEGNVQMADAYVWAYLGPLLAPSSPSLTASATAVTVGSPVTLSVTAGGVPPFTYAWFTGSSGDLSHPVAGVTGASYTTPGLAASTSYWVQVSNPTGVRNTAAIPITVTGGSTVQTITFAALAGTTLATPTLALSATASSGLPVVFSSLTPGICGVSGSTVTLLAAGTCTVAADQPGDGNYARAPQVTRSFAVARAAQSIAFATLAGRSLSASPFTVGASASSGLAVAFSSLSASVCTVSGVAVTLLTTGICTIAANQPGNAVYAPAGQVSQSFTVTAALAAQTITFAAITDRPVGSAPFTVKATASSGLVVTIAAQTATTCTVGGATVTVRAAGVCTLEASQAGNSTYAAAAPVVRSFNVTAGTIGATSDGPLPWWATAALGTVLAGVARRRLRRPG